MNMESCIQITSGKYLSGSPKIHRGQRMALIELKNIKRSLQLGDATVHQAKRAKTIDRSS